MIIGIGYFIKTEKDRLDAFLSWWRASHSDDPESYPMWMEDGDWEEQYACWVDVQKLNAVAGTL